MFVKVNFVLKTFSKSVKIFLEISRNISCFYYIIKWHILLNKSSALLTILSATLNGFISSIILDPGRIILENWVFENYILVDEPFTKALQIFETCVSVNNNLCGKLVSSLEFPVKFDEELKVTSVPFVFHILTY